MNIFETIYTNLIKLINKPLSKIISPEKEYKDVKDLNLNEIEEWNISLITHRRSVLQFPKIFHLKRIIYRERIMIKGKKLRLCII